MKEAREIVISYSRNPRGWASCEKKEINPVIGLDIQGIRKMIYGDVTSGCFFMGNWFKTALRLYIRINILQYNI